jgi:hypothetical protein
VSGGSVVLGVDVLVAIVVVGATVDVGAVVVGAVVVGAIVVGASVAGAAVLVDAVAAGAAVVVRGAAVTWIGASVVDVVASTAEGIVDCDGSSKSIAGTEVVRAASASMFVVAARATGIDVGPGETSGVTASLVDSAAAVSSSSSLTSKGPSAETTPAKPNTLAVPTLARTRRRRIGRFRIDPPRSCHARTYTR